MSQYLTPLKESNQMGSKQSKTNTQPREGDWVCLNCNNLNFSFRKKCNRCRVQTREHNEQVSAYYYNYYPKPMEDIYYVEQKENFPILHQQAQPAAPALRDSCSIPVSPSGSRPRDDQTPQKTKQRQELPSVSPLVKRYNRHESNSTQESRKGLFENEGLWADIDLKYLDEPQKYGLLDSTDEGGEMEEIERIIQRIML